MLIAILKKLKNKFKKINKMKISNFQLFKCFYLFLKGKNRKLNKRLNYSKLKKKVFLKIKMF